MRMLHTMLRVGNLDKSIDFYTNVLGMRVLRRNDYPDGKFTLEARLVTFENDQVKLERREGTTITVPLAKLSEADNAFVRRKPNKRSP